MKLVSLPCFLFCCVISSIFLNEFFETSFVFAQKTTSKIVPVTVSANSEHTHYEGFQVLDGDPNTIWHTRFNQGAPTHPHELIVDLKNEYSLRGIQYVPRQDLWNGAVGKYEIFLSNDSKNFGEPICKGEFEKTKETQTLLFETPQKTRYLKIRALSEVDNRPWASIAELTPLCENEELVFRAKPFTALELAQLDLGSDFDPSDELAQQYAFLLDNLANRDHFEKVAKETFLKDSLILPEDRDPLDVVLRRTSAVLTDLCELNESFPKNFSSDLAALQKLADEISVDQKSERYAVYRKVCQLRRTIVFSNPLLNFNEILFVKKHRATYSHMCDQYYGINLPNGGGLFVLSNPFEEGGSEASAPLVNTTSVEGSKAAKSTSLTNPASADGAEAPVSSLQPPASSLVRNLLESSRVQNGRLQGQLLNHGAFATPDISFDAQKIAFAYVEGTGDREQRLHTDPSKGHWHEGRSFHVFTVNADGSDLRQLTDGTWNDFDPCFLPNDRIAFISERRNGYLRCGRACPTFTLFDMNPEGGQMRCLSYHETNEWNPSVSHDGRILYTRWDYVDRYGCIAHHPWLTTLDGRDAREVHGNFVPRHSRPDMELDCRFIPNSKKIVATAAPHHGQAFGTLVLVDPQVDDTNDPMGPIKRITPDVGFPESQNGVQIYGSPWPLSEKYYLAVADFSVKPREGVEGGKYIRGDYGIYLIDAFGNKELLYRDPEIGSVSPIPLTSRPTPSAPPQLVENEDIGHQPFVAPIRGENQPEAVVSVINVYQSLKPYPTGTKIKELRILQIIPMSVPSGRPPHEVGFREPSSLDSVVLCRYVLGTVPVEEDGSAHFVVPAQKEILFQAIDENGLAVQSMRSATYLKEGELLVCNGCHEPKFQAPLQSNVMPVAFKRAPSQIKPDVPEANPFSYPLLVQPILDKHCVDCHAEEIAKGTANVPNLAKDPIVRKWYTSFNELVPKYGFYDYKDPLVTTPGKFGAHAAPLYKLLKDGHYDVKLSEEEMHKIVLWLDCVSPFYGVYEAEGGEAQLRGEVAYPTLE